MLQKINEKKNWMHFDLAAQIFSSSKPTATQERKRERENVHVFHLN